MGTIDIILILCFLPCIYFGLKKGLVKLLISFCTVYFGITLSLRFSAPVIEWIGGHLKISPFAAKTISFVLIFFGIAIVFSLFGRLVEKVLQITLLGWVNRLLGLAVSCLIFIVALSSIIFLVDSANNLMHFISEEQIGASKLYPLLLDLAKQIFPYFKQIF